MADGDIIRLGVPGPYCKAYQMLCEGLSNSEDCAREAARGVQKLIKRYKEQPRQLLQHMAQRFEQMTGQPGQLSPSQCAALDKEIDRMCRRLGGHKHGMDAAAAACRAKLNALECGEPPGDIHHELCQLFVERIADSTFTSRVASLPRHLDDLPANIVNKRLADILPDFNRNLEGYAQQLDSSTSSNKTPKLRRRRGAKPVIHRKTSLL
jgi:hypothetical protein